jgi:hypothetical protein
MTQFLAGPNRARNVWRVPDARATEPATTDIRVVGKGVMPLKRIGLGIVSVLVAGLVAVSPVGAATKKKAATHRVTCKEIKDAIAAGKSEEDAAKELKTSAATVKKCTAPAPTHHRAAKKKTAS